MSENSDKLEETVLDLYQKKAEKKRDRDSYTER